MSAIALNNPLIPSAGVPPANWLFATMAPSGNQLFSCTLAQLATAVVAQNAAGVTRAPTFVIDGGGTVFVTGIAGSLYVPFACTISAVTLLAPHESGSVVVDIWKTPFGSYPANVGNSICASDLPTITSAQSHQDTTLTGWTTAITAGDTLTFNVNSVTSLTKLTIALTVA